MVCSRLCLETQLYHRCVDAMRRARAVVDKLRARHQGIVVGVPSLGLYLPVHARYATAHLMAPVYYETLADPADVVVLFQQQRLVQRWFRYLW